MCRKKLKKLKTLVLVFHPNLEQSRGNRYLLEEMIKQSNVTIHDIYEAYPDEQIDVKVEQELLEKHDRII